MPPFTVQIQVATLTDPTLIKTTPLPHKPTKVHGIDYFWNNISQNSKIDLWLQNGQVAGNPADAGNISLTSFTLPSGGAKDAQEDHETLCRPIQGSYDTLAFKIIPGAAGTKGMQATVTFEA